MKAAPRFALFLAALVAAIAVVFPLFWALSASLRPEAELFGSRNLVPNELVLVHYRALFSERSFWVPIENSVIVAGSTALIATVIGTAAAYAIARLHFAGKRLVVAALLAVGMFPQISIVAPLFLVLRTLHLIDTYPGLVLPYLTFALPLSVWLLVGYFEKLHPALEEAALLDGAGRLRCLLYVVVPVAMPGIVTTAILTFIYCWNEFLFALSFTVSPERQTVPVAIALFRARYQIPWGQVMAAAVLATAPVAALVFAFQQRIVASFQR